MSREERIADLVWRVLICYERTFDDLFTVVSGAWSGPWPYDLTATEVDAAARPYERGAPGRYSYALTSEQHPIFCPSCAAPRTHDRLDGSVCYYCSCPGYGAGWDPHG